MNNIPVPNENFQNDVFHVYVLEMDIKENMGYLKRRAGEYLKVDLSEAAVWVLSQKMVADFETLEELCGSYVGMVQIQFQVIFNARTGEQKVEILDVLQANEEHSNNMDIETESSLEIETESSCIENSRKSQVEEKLKTSQWIASTTFKSIQKENKIPKNPMLWSSTHVSKWLSWARHHFRLKNLNPHNVILDGRTLCNFGVEEFRHLVPCDPGDIFYMHFEILRKTHTVAIVFKRTLSERRPSTECIEESEMPNSSLNRDSENLNHEIPRIDLQPNPSSPPADQSIPNGHTTAGSSTQTMQLWQFLLQLLTDPESTNVISWCGANGEFKFHQPDLVAKLWGEHKGKNNMNYEKLSRALRYYYVADKMINKVSGMKYVYKFEMDLRSLLGYNSLELQHHMSQVEQPLSANNLSSTSSDHSDAG